MPIDTRTVSFSQFGELMGVEPQRIVGVLADRRAQIVTILLEPEDDDADHRDISAVGG